MSMKCRYIYKGQTFESEAALDDFLIEKRKYESKFGDLVFQRTAPFLHAKDIIENKILKDSSNMERLMQEARLRAGSFDGDEILEFKAPYIGVTKFLSGLEVNEELLFPEFRVEEYWKRRIESWTKPLESGEELYSDDKDKSRFTKDEIDIFFEGDTFEEKLSKIKLLNQDESKQLRELMTNKWDYQAAAGTAVHYILQRYFTKDENTGKILGDSERNTIIDEISKTIEKDLKEDLGSRYREGLYNEKTIEDAIVYADLLKKQLRKLHGENCEFYPELGVSAKMHNVPSDKPGILMGYIDLAVLGENGQINYYDYKTSPKEYADFGSAKKLAYTYQLAAYGKLFRQYGLDYRNSDIGILPLQFQELQLLNPEEAHSNPKKSKFGYKTISWGSDIIQREVKQRINAVDSRGNQPVLDNLDDYLPEEMIVDIPTEKCIENVEEQLKTWFPDYQKYKAKSDEEIKQMLEEDDALKPVERNGKKVYAYKTKYGNKEIIADDELELIEKIKKQQERQEKSREWMASTVVKALKYGIKNNTTDIGEYITSIDTKGLANETGLSKWFSDYLSRYCNDNWEVVEHDTLKHFGIIVLRNKLNKNQIDVIKMTSTPNIYYNPFESNKETKKKNKNHLLSYAFQPDIVEQSNQKSLMLDGYKGNIELLETVLVLNNIPGFFTKDYSGAVIGDIQVMNSYRGEGIHASNEELLYTFQKLNQLSPLKHENNISSEKVKFGTAFDIAKNMFIDAMTPNSDFNLKESEFNSAKLDLDKAIDGTVDKKIAVVEDIIRRLETSYKYLKGGVTRENILSKPEARLYVQMLQALAGLRGVTFKQQIKDHDKWLQEKTFKGILSKGVSGTYIDNPGNLLSDTLNQVTKLVTQAYQNIRNSMTSKVAQLRKATEELKKAKGYYGAAQYIGNATNMYKNMVEMVDGDLLFKDLNSIKDPAEKKYLKLVLEIINENRFGGKVSKDELEYWRESHDLRYYRVPLVIGSSESQDSIEGFKKGFTERLKRFNPKNALEELRAATEGIFIEDAPSQDRAEYLFDIANRFDRTENSPKERKEALTKMGEGFFEHNLEMLCFKHTYAYESAKQFNKVFPMMKAAMAYLTAAGTTTNKNFENDVEYLTGYMRSSIKGQPLEKNDEMKEATLVSGKLKQVASFMALAFSPVQFMYQSIQGLWQDISLIIRKPDGTQAFTWANMWDAAKVVYSDLRHFSDKPTKCQLINEWLGVNDMDMNIYAERMRTDVHNKYNFTNLAFKFASRPDYYNRMVIIVAKMKADGIWDALEVKDGQLVYNYKKDKRFLAYSSGNTSDPNYNKQASLYHTIAEQFVAEGTQNPDGSQFQIGQPLPYAWTNQEAESVKSLCDLIYGYYSHEKKSLIHATFLGSLYMQMRTYWSGKKNQYLAPGGVRIQGKWEQAVDNITKKPLYYQLKSDGTIDYDAPLTTDETSAPFYQWKGQWQEGVILTCAEIFRHGLTMEGLKEGWNETWNNQDENIRTIRQANLKQMIGDLSFYGLISTLIAGLLMADWDKELQKEAKESGEFGDALKATSFKLIRTSFGQSADDFNWWSSIGSPLIGWNPFALSQSTYLFGRLSNIIMGDQDFYTGVVNSFAAGKQMKPLMQWLNPQNFISE